MKIAVEAEISLASLAGEVASAICAEVGGVKIIFIKLQINPSVTTQGRDSASLRLGHAPALNVHRTFIHYRRAASVP